MIVHLVTPDVDEVFALDDTLDEEIADAEVGEYDGNEAKQSCTPMARTRMSSLWDVMEPIIRRSSPASGSYVIKRYGEASDPSAKEVRIEL